MHTDENTYDTFIPRWFGRLGNNIQQISNGIYFCEKNGIHFTSPDHTIIEAIDLDFGPAIWKIPETSHNWFYFFDGPECDFNVDVDDLNRNRKRICEQYILPKLKINHEFLDKPIPDDFLVIHIRSGDLYTKWPASHPQNPLKYYNTLGEMFDFNVLVFAEDTNNPIVQELKRMGADVITLGLPETYTALLMAKNLATSGAGSFAISAAFCSKNIRNFYCSDLYIPNSLNPLMLKEQLNVFMADIDGNKYIKGNEWNPQVIDKIFNYDEVISFRRL
jgi:hypothetical protein